MSIPEVSFPAFSTPGRDILVFKQSGTLFSMLLTDKSVVHFETESKEDFRRWLLVNRVREALPIQETKAKSIH